MTTPTTHCQHATSFPSPRWVYALWDHRVLVCLGAELGLCQVPALPELLREHCIVICRIARKTDITPHLDNMPRPSFAGVYTLITGSPRVGVGACAWAFQRAAGNHTNFPGVRQTQVIDLIAALLVLLQQHCVVMRCI